MFFWGMLAVFCVITADFYVPMLPSSTLVAAVASLVYGDPLLIGVLLLCAAGASWLGEWLGFRLFKRIRTSRRGRSWTDRFVGSRMFNSVRKAEQLLQGTVTEHPYLTTVVARFLPAGRTTLAWVAAGAERVPYPRMAALGGALWAVYAVGISLLVTWVAGSGIQSLIGSVLSVAAVGALLGWAARRWRQSRTVEPAPAPVLVEAERS